jgi:SanA protein
MEIKKRTKKYLKYFLVLCLLSVVFTFIINAVVKNKSKEFIYDKVKDVPPCYTALVLGAMVSQSGYPSDFLKDRMDIAIELYKNKKVKRFLLSGDHGQKNYDEVNSMKKYLLDKGIDTSDIFLDHAGFDTYSSIVRAKEIFQVKDVIIVTQEFHLSRAVYIARKKGLNAYGMVADKREYLSIKRLKIRELMANVKAFWEVLINKEPKFLGSKIPITGDSKLSYD